MMHKICIYIDFIKWLNVSIGKINGNSMEKVDQKICTVYFQIEGKQLKVRFTP